MSEPFWLDCDVKIQLICTITASALSPPVTAGTSNHFSHFQEAPRRQRLRYNCEESLFDGQISVVNEVLPPRVKMLLSLKRKLKKKIHLLV